MLCESLRVGAEALAEEAHEFHVLQTRAEAVEVEHRAAQLPHSLETPPEHLPMCFVVGIERDDLIAAPVLADGDGVGPRGDADLFACGCEGPRELRPCRLDLGRQDVEIGPVHLPARIFAAVPPEENSLKVVMFHDAEKSPGKRSD